MGTPAGRQTRWGKAGAPQRGGLPGVQRRVSTNEAEAAPAVAAGQHDKSAGAPAMPVLTGGAHTSKSNPARSAITSCTKSEAATCSGCFL